MNNLAAEITRTLDEYQRRWKSPDTLLEAESVRRKLLNDIEILRNTLGHYGTLDRVKASQFRELISSKLEMMQRNSASPSDWWWETPTHPMMESLLATISLSLSGAIRPPARRLSFAWAIVKELLFLGIVVALLLAGRNNFETRVVAILVLIYTYIGLESGRLGFHLTGFELEMGYVVGRIARRMGIKWDDLEERAAAREGMVVNLDLRTLSLYTARVVAIVGLALSFL
jgi:hypothetical protein